MNEPYWVMNPELKKYRKPHPMGFTHKVGDSFGWFEVCERPFLETLYVMVSPKDLVIAH